MAENKEEKKDLKQEDAEESTEEESTPETSEEKETLKNEETEETTEESEESSEEKVEELLKDGTPANKRVTIPKDKLDNLTADSKLFEQFKPLLSKLQENPDVVEKVMGKDAGESAETRITRLEEADKAKKRDELRGALTKAVEVWKDFTKHWSDVRPIMESLERRGTSVEEAMQRAYYSVNPDALKQEERLVNMKGAQEIQNDQGKTSSGGGIGKKVVQESTVELSAEDAEFARLAGIDPKLYIKFGKDIEKFKDL